MADASLQGLEREVAASPTDGARRVALATALDRAGRRPDALRALDLAGCDDLFDARAALAASLWARALGGLAPTGVEAAAEGRVEARFGADGRHVIWEGTSDAPQLGVFDAATGTSLLRAPGHRLQAVFDGGLFSRDWRRPGVVVRWTFAGHAEEDVADGSIVSASPDGRRLHLLREGVGLVLAWPGLQVIDERPRGWWVDWPSGTVVADRERALVARPLGGGPERVLPVGRTSGTLARLRSLGDGVVVASGEGLRLLHLVAGWTLPVLEAAPGRVPTPSLAGDRRGLRVVASERVVRIEVDLSRGALRAPVPPDLARRPLADELVHPHADVAAVLRRGRWQLRGTTGPPLLVLPPSAAPLAWSPDGERLVVARVDAHPARLEVWACGP